MYRPNQQVGRMRCSETTERQAWGLLGEQADRPSDWRADVELECLARAAGGRAPSGPDSVQEGSGCYGLAEDRLFADAEAGEDATKQIVGTECPGDLAQCLLRLTKVFSQELTCACQR